MCGQMCNNLAGGKQEVQEGKEVLCRGLLSCFTFIVFMFLPPGLILHTYALWPGCLVLYGIPDEFLLCCTICRLNQLSAQSKCARQKLFHLFSPEATALFCNIGLSEDTHSVYCRVFVFQFPPFQSHCTVLHILGAGWLRRTHHSVLHPLNFSSSSSFPLSKLGTRNSLVGTLCIWSWCQDAHGCNQASIHSSAYVLKVTCLCIS